nr:MAG TPA: hypothetical protein [Caudoviricetes sp.]
MQERMSIDKFQPPSDMARVLLVPVSEVEYNAIVEGKICVVFVPYDSDWKDSVVLEEKMGANGEKECLFRQYDFVQLDYKNSIFTRILRRWCGFSVTSSRVFDSHHRLVGFSDYKIAIHFK